MEQIFFLILSIIILISGIFVIYDLNQKQNEDLKSLTIKENVNILSKKFDEYCKDPFSGTNFKITNNEKFKLYSNGSKVCASDNNTTIFCEKLMCNATEMMIFNIGEFERENVCIINKNIINNNLEVNCSK